MIPLTGALSRVDLAMLERYADPNALLRLGSKRLTTLIVKASHGHLGADRAEQRLAAAGTSVELYAGHPAVAFTDLAAAVATEIRLLPAVQAELVDHAAAQETCYRWSTLELARSLPGVADIGGPALVAVIGDPTRFPHRQGVPLLHRPGAQGLRDRRYRAHGPTHVQGAPHCSAPAWSAPPTTPATKPRSTDGVGEVSVP